MIVKNTHDLLYYNNIVMTTYIFVKIEVFSVKDVTTHTGAKSAG
jgi:hypothetical protein